MTTRELTGLEGVVAASTRLSLVDGNAGRLILAGYPVEEIAPRAKFEEMVHLLWYGRLPTLRELKELTANLASRRRLPLATLTLLREAAGNSTPVMDALRMAAGTLSLGRRESPEEDALTLVAAFPAIVGGYWRLKNEQEPIQPRDDFSHADYCLHQMFGGEIGAERARGLETYLNAVCDHGLNASTFAARVIVSTRSDLVSAVSFTSSHGTLKKLLSEFLRSTNPGVVWTPMLNFIPHYFFMVLGCPRNRLPQPSLSPEFLGGLRIVLSSFETAD